MLLNLLCMLVLMSVGSLFIWCMICVMFIVCSVFV